MKHMEKIEVEGIILILSCQKHKNTRLRELNLLQNSYENWRVVKVIGDLFLKENYKFQDDFLIVKTEDSYLHLLKKLVLSIKYVNELFNIKQGILRCGDDLVFNEANLIQLLKIHNKPDFFGYSPTGYSLLLPKLEDLQKTRLDYFMANYYANHQEDFLNPHYNLKGININNYVKRPVISIGASGTLYYISNYSCNLLIKKMEEINYNILAFDEFSQSYPYTIEDTAVSFILYLNQISFFNVHNLVADVFHNFENNVAVATNKYK